jgi:hypothetical protein
VFKGVDPPLPSLFGLELGGVGWRSQFVLDPDPCRVVDLFNREQASMCTPPLSSYSPAAVGKSGCLRLKHSDWVFQTAKEIHCVMGVLCVGYEEQFMAILTVIEAGRPHMVPGSTSKGNRELKRLECPINYDFKFETSNCASAKERCFSVFNEA